MATDLTGFESRIRAHQNEWDALPLTFTVKPISPNYGKAVTSSEFESADWLVSLDVWETGELDLNAIRKADGWHIVKHHDLEAVDQLDAVFTELIALFRAGAVPVDAFTSWLLQSFRSSAACVRSIAAPAAFAHSRHSAERLSGS